MLPEEGGDGPAPDSVAQVGERALNPGIAPVAILGRHAHDQLPNLGHHGRPSGPAPLLAVVFPGDQVAMPGEQGVGAHNGSDLAENSPTQILCLGGQSHTLIVGESQSSRSELLSEDAILRPEIVDDIALVLVDPAGEGNNEKLERMRERRHQRSVPEGQCGGHSGTAATVPSRVV
jgi:hypothetical protein